MNSITNVSIIIVEDNRKGNMWGTHLTWTLGSILFFSAIHAVAHVAFLKFLSPAKRAALSFDDRISLSEKYVLRGCIGT